VEDNELVVAPMSRPLGFWLIGHCPTFADEVPRAKICFEALAVWGDGMPSSEYYHRQADLCMRMALSGCAYEERIRLIDRANEYRDRASQAEALGSHAPRVRAIKTSRKKLTAL
jgi:hypothetical protein